MRRVELAMCLRDTGGFNQTRHRGKDSAGSTMGNIAASITERLVPNIGLFSLDWSFSNMSVRISGLFLPYMYDSEMDVMAERPSGSSHWKCERDRYRQGMSQSWHMTVIRLGHLEPPWIVQPFSAKISMLFRGNTARRLPVCSPVNS